ncbi:MAG: MBL fold metallo-hydrolase [Deltaproteobacteria bacterium]|nr:MBL fold metallo-hydrolase [Deltaproteobacteria bacterium]MBW2698205.1 MBL fold metallo-hydrolase [Deltaproteobacteria bacterium]
MPDIDRWSRRVVTALGQNPSSFTGPGTNTYLVGTGKERILLDTGDGRRDYLPVLADAMEYAGCRALQEIVLTHGHPDHIGGVESVIERFGPLRVTKLAYDEFDQPYDFQIRHLADGESVKTEGATLLALHTPGHAPDHLCFLLEEENAIFTGDNVLGVGTTVIPSDTGSLSDYMDSLRGLLDRQPDKLFPAHGPLIEDGCAKLSEYIAHRLEREEQILDVIKNGAAGVTEMVKIIYAAYPTNLHTAAGQSVASHLIKLEAEGRVQRENDMQGAATVVRWQIV